MRHVGISALALAVSSVLAPFASASINFTGAGGGTSFFLNTNWTGNTLPPGNTTPTDSGINIAAIVEFDPISDANAANAGTYTYAAGFGATAANTQTIWRLYLSSGSATSATLNIRSGSLIQADDGAAGTGQAIIGRNGTGIVNQYAGNFIQQSNNIDLGSNQNTTGDHSGTWNYYGGTFEAGLLNTTNGTTGAMRLGAATLAGAANSTDGTLNIYNTGPSGHVRFKNLLVSSGSGNNGSVGTIGFHYGVNPNDASNAGVRPIQIYRTLQFNNSASQSSRLGFSLDANPETTLVGETLVPENLGLFDVAFPNAASLSPTRTGTLMSDDGLTSLTEGSIIERVAPDGFTYRWTLSYTGAITYTDADNSLVSSVTGPNNLLGASITDGVDIVLIGLSSTAPIPEPAGVMSAAVPSLLLARRRR